MKNIQKVIKNTTDRDTITTILKVVSAVYLIMNTVRLGMDLHEKIVNKQNAKRIPN